MKSVGYDVVVYYYSHEQTTGVRLPNRVGEIDRHVGRVRIGSSSTDSVRRRRGSFLHIAKQKTNQGTCCVLPQVQHLFAYLITLSQLVGTGGKDLYSWGSSATRNPWMVRKCHSHGRAIPQYIATQLSRVVHL